MIIMKLVSTMNGIYTEDPNCQDTYFINQGTKNHTIDCRWYNTDTIGLSNSRNIALSLLKSNEIGIISDNDVLMVKDYKSIIEDAFNRFPDADIITFQAYNKDGSPLKKYKKNSFKHGKLSIMRVSSIEIVIKKTKQPKFDKSFGLGAQIPIGEENIFLSDSLKKGLNIYFCPQFICTHNDSHHTGLSFTRETNKYRRKVFIRVYGAILGRAIYLMFILKNSRKISGGLIKNLVGVF